MAIKPRIEWSDFEKIDIRCGTIIEVQTFAKARKPAYKLFIDFGELGILKSSAQITELYTPPTLIGKQVLAVVNFEPKQIANFMSECLVLGVYTKNGVVLLNTETKTDNGLSVG